MTQFLGFPHYGDEYKVMGLAPYGQPRYVDEMREIVRLKRRRQLRARPRYFRHATGEGRHTTGDGGHPAVRPAVDATRSSELLGPRARPAEPLEQRHSDIARSVQAMYEEAFFHLLSALHERYGIDALVLAGGCGYNSVANGKIFERIAVQRPLRAGRRRRCRRRDRRGLRVWHKARATAPSATS